MHYASFTRHAFTEAAQRRAALVNAQLWTLPQIFS